MKIDILTLMKDIIKIVYKFNIKLLMCFGVLIVLNMF